MTPRFLKRCDIQNIIYPIQEDLIPIIDSNDNGAVDVGSDDESFKNNCTNLKEISREKLPNALDKLENGDVRLEFQFKMVECMGHVYQQPKSCNKNKA